MLKRTVSVHTIHKTAKSSGESTNEKGRFTQISGPCVLVMDDQHTESPLTPAWGRGAAARGRGGGGKKGGG